MSFSSCSRSLIASSSKLPLSTTQYRTISSSPASLAAAAKKTAKGRAAPPLRKQGGSFNKARTGGSGGGSSGGGGKNKGELLTVSTPDILLTPTSTALNALPVFSTEGIESAYGQAVRYPTGEWERANSFGMARRIEKEFALTQPTTIIRQDSVDILKRMDNAKSSLDNRILMAGPKGCGKSSVMVQAVMAGLLDEWVVVYIPRAIDLISSSSSYAYRPSTQTFHQPTLSANMLSSILKANEATLSRIALKEDRTWNGITVEAGQGLDKLVGLGAKDETSSVGVLESVMTILGRQTQYGVLLAIDEAQALFMRSAYRSPDFDLLESYAMSLPRLFLDYVSGRKELARGVVLAALTMSQPHHMPPDEVYAAFPSELCPPTPLSGFAQLDEHHVEHAKGLKVKHIQDSLALIEAHQMGKIWRDKRLVPYLTDELLLRKFAESGGNAAEFGRGMFNAVAA